LIEVGWHPEIDRCGGNLHHHSNDHIQHEVRQLEKSEQIHSLTWRVRSFCRLDGKDHSFLFKQRQATKRKCRHCQSNQCGKEKYVSPIQKDSGKTRQQRTRKAGKGQKYATDARIFGKRVFGDDLDQGSAEHGKTEAHQSKRENAEYFDSIPIKDQQSDSCQRKSARHHIFWLDVISDHAVDQLSRGIYDHIDRCQKGKVFLGVCVAVEHLWCQHAEQIPQKIAGDVCKNTNEADLQRFFEL